MARTFIRNVSGVPMALAYPYRSYLAPSAVACVGDDKEQTIENMGGDEWIVGIFSVEVAPDDAPVTPHYVD